MGLLEMLRERGGGVRPPPDLVVKTFEYVRVGSAALVRAGGAWTTPSGGEREVTLCVRAGDGRRHEVAALAEDDSGDRLGWKAAFPLTSELIEDAATEFSLLAPGGSIDLPRPLRRALRADDESTLPSEPASPREQMLESRVREAEAGLRWIEEQLRNERDRRRRFEREMASLEERNAALRGELHQLSAFALESAGLRPVT